MRQEWFDTNRERFEAATTATDKAPNKCAHYLERKTATTVECRSCNAGWIDMGQWKVENGKIKPHSD